MRIGIHLSDANESSGGAFTFKKEICKAIIELASKTNHELFLFHDSNISFSFNEEKNLHSVILKASIIRRVYYKLIRIFFSIVKSIFGEEFGSIKSIKKYSIDEDYINKYKIDILWYVGPHCVTMDTPYIFTVLDLQHRIQPYFPEVSNYGVWENRERLYSERLRRASFVIVSTELGKLEIEQFYQIPSERIFVLPYAAPPIETEDQDSSFVLKKYNLEPGYLFYPAQLWPQKNHIGLLHAIKILRDKWNIRISAVFVDSDKGNQKYINETIKKLDLSSQIHLLGFVPRRDLIAFYKNALALTMPTLVGPDNIPSLEAFSLECPVISSNLPGFKEQLGDAAILVDPKNEEAIALSIKSLYEDEDLRKVCVEKGIKRVSEWTWIDYVKGALKIIDDFKPIRRTWSTNDIYK